MLKRIRIDVENEAEINAIEDLFILFDKGAEHVDRKINSIVSKIKKKKASVKEVILVKMFHKVIDVVEKGDKILKKKGVCNEKMGKSGRRCKGKKCS